MSDQELLEEAEKRGFLNASRIKPAHLLYNSEKCPTIVIPEKSSFIFEHNCLVYSCGDSSNFRDIQHKNNWYGMIYERKTGNWAEIVEKHDEVTKAGWPILRDFPSSGVCWSKDQNLIKYLKIKFSKDNRYIQPTHQGIAWNSNGYWGVTTYSNQTPYSISQLMPFIRPTPDFATPLTPDECYLPQKWCLQISPGNFAKIKDFIHEHRNEYIGYQDSWDPSQALNLYFCYPQEVDKCYADIVIPRGYTHISNDDFLKHVLTHTDKQNPVKIKQQENERSTTERGIEVQRLDITVRDTGSIRAVGIRCSKIQIKVGSGYLPN